MNKGSKIESRWLRQIWYYVPVIHEGSPKGFSNLWQAVGLCTCMMFQHEVKNLCIPGSLHKLVPWRSRSRPYSRTRRKRSCLCRCTVSAKYVTKISLCDCQFRVQRILGLFCYSFKPRKKTLIEGQKFWQLRTRPNIIGYKQHLLNR